ncbi:MAG: PTS sugar transporter subunit IIB [Quinella sp. 1Q7]|nr:PTS sugar transporter subunit IIB [Quinella sp. 1Q7]
MMAIKKILCFCGSGLGTSFMMEMNCKKALKQLGIKGVEVDHTTIDDIVPGAADLFVCGADLVEKAQAAGSAIGLKNILSAEEMTQKLKEVFGK